MVVDGVRFTVEENALVLRSEYNGDQRETDTFDTFFESSWYYARYCCPTPTQMLDERARYWLPVTSMSAVSNTRSCTCCTRAFFNKLMRDEGLVDCDELFTRLLTQGMVVAETPFPQQPTV